MKMSMPARGGSAFGGRKFVILLSALSLIAASCDTAGLLDFNTGVRGVFKSEDGGETFLSANRLKNKGDISSVSVNSVALDPNNADTLFIGTTSGIYKSEDAAKSWRYILSGMVVASVVMDPLSSQLIYASGIAGSNGKIIKSNDAGASWTDIYTEPSKDNAVLALAVSSSNSSLILAGLTNGEIIRSGDSGRTWQVTKDLADRAVKMEFGSAGIYVLTAQKGLFKSTDQGNTWTQITNNLTATSLNSTTGGSTSVSAFYDFALDQRQQGVVYLGTEQGIFRTVNDGTNWSFLTLPVKNGALRVSSVAVNPLNSNNLLVSIGTTMFKSLNGGLTWETRRLPVSAEVHVILFNPISPNIIYLGLRSL